MCKKGILKILVFCLLGFFGLQVKAQSLHHQMLSSLGSTNILKNGMIVRQTVGQQSVIGSSSLSNIIIQQGFQQSMVSKFIPVYNISSIETTIYPNPFLSALNIKFSETISEKMSAALYNMFGVMVYKREYNAPLITMDFNFEQLAPGSYILVLTSKNYTHSKTLIKL
ncbi:T9SS type A sorting domain-containing protein [Pedobacter aquae]|uniref:T9SS type A sorting domain-containing protein n=1 Tax=Pedobacter aquae TaxID=2605747 RepID=A0A5C0VII3_9SPHI|nr:T9SS type A sorting domain-containing protein [Pedobacter aquae]QEK52316.1 T9SS type A sorting domain-containing protein [Pedobacter aquae]